MEVRHDSLHFDSIMNLFHYESISVIWTNTPRIAFNVLCDFFMTLRNSKESILVRQN